MCCVHTTSAQGECSASSDREQLSREHNSGAQGPARKWVSVLLGCTTGRGEITQRGERSSSRPAASRAAGPSWPCLHVTVPHHYAPQCYISPFWAGSWLSADGRQASAKALLWGSWGCGSSAGNPMALGPLWAGAKDHETQQEWGSAGGCTPESDAWRSSQHLEVGISPAPNASCFYRSHLV